LTVPTVQGTSLQLSYWDLWFSIVAVMMHDSDLDRLAGWIKEDKVVFYDRRSIERKRCHIRDLKRRLDEASLIPAELVLAAPDLAKTEKRRALRKVSESIRQEREFSEPMRKTPANGGSITPCGVTGTVSLSRQSIIRRRSGHTSSPRLSTQRRLAR